MNVLMQLFGGEHDSVTDGTFAPEGKKFDAVITGDGAVVTEALDVNGDEVTKDYITSGTAMTGAFLPFPKCLTSITVTSTVFIYNIRPLSDS